MGWLPLGLAKAWSDVFVTYYHRYESHEREYNMFYMVFYVGFGLCGQLASLKLISEPTNKNAKYIFGLFHVAMSVYHSLYAFRLIQGKFKDIDSDDWGPFKPAVQVEYLMCFVASIDFLLSPSYNVQRKRVLDLVTSCNLLPLGFFLAFTRCGYHNPMAGKVVVYVTMIITPMILLFGQCKEVMLKFADKDKSKSS